MKNQPLPQLVIIDGGKGQLSAAMESILELELTWQTDTCRSCKK